MQDAMTILVHQAVQHSTFARIKRVLVDEAPVALIKLERLLARYRIVGITVPCDQAKLGEVPDQKEISCGVHETIMHHEQIIIKPP